MHFAGYYYPHDTLLYAIDDIIIKDIFSICNPIFQIKVELIWRQLTIIPVTYDDMSFEWEQISGPLIEEIHSVNSLEPVIIASDDAVEDMKFRLYIDRGTDFEKTKEVTVYRTPTSNGSINNYLPKLNISPQLGNPSVSFNTFPTLNSANLIKDVTVIPNVLYAGNNELNQTSEDITSFSVLVKYNDDILRAGHLITAIEAFNPQTNELIAASTFSDIINLPKETAVFYLKFYVNLFYSDSRRPSVETTVLDFKVRSTYIKFLKQNLKSKVLYLTEFASSTFVKSNVNSGSEIESRSTLPTTLVRNDEAAIQNINQNRVNLIESFSKTSYKPKFLGNIPEDEFTENKPSDVEVTNPTELTVERFFGITIGGG